MPEILPASADRLRLLGSFLRDIKTRGDSSGKLTDVRPGAASRQGERTDRWQVQMVELFLSFSGDDNGKNLVAGFFEDLCSELSNVTGMSKEALGYNYLEMRAAMKWRRELVAALGSCKVFVPLYSPRYFASEFCGKEWWGFSYRQQQYAHANATSEPELIFPVIWESVFNDRVQMPQIAADIWARERKLGERYAETGLRQLVQLKHHEDYAPMYQEIIFALRGPNRSC
jgi:hypothetical protein